MMEDYRSALRAGQRAYRASVARGQSPISRCWTRSLPTQTSWRRSLWGWWTSRPRAFVGTKTAGRHTAFAPNFMPILEADSEFARKWSNLCDAHLEEGIRYPVTAYEYLNKFYVEEGNKRSRCSSTMRRSRSPAP